MLSHLFFLYRWSVDLLSHGIILLIPCGSSNGTESGERRSSDNSGTLNSYTSDNNNSNNNNNNNNNSNNSNNNNISDSFSPSLRRPSLTTYRNISQTSINPFDNDTNTNTNTNSSLHDPPESQRGSILQLKIDKIQCKGGDFLEINGNLFLNEIGNSKGFIAKSLKDQKNKDDGIFFGTNPLKMKEKSREKDIDMEMEERGREMERERDRIRGRNPSDSKFGLRQDPPGVPKRSDGLVYGSRTASGTGVGTGTGWGTGTGTGFGYDKDRPRERPAGVTHIERYIYNCFNFCIAICVFLHDCVLQYFQSYYISITLYLNIIL